MTQPWQQNPYERRPVDINAYAPPKRPGGTGWFIALAVVVVAAVLAVVFLRPQPAPAPQPTAAPSSQPTASGPGMPFSLPNTTGNEGRWQILDQSWDGDQLTVKVRIDVDKGTISYGFVAFSNSGVDVYDPVDGAPAPQLDTGRLSAGESVEGYVRLEIPRGPATLILTTSAGRQISALPISG